jgi:hypothetical protein
MSKRSKKVNKKDVKACRFTNKEDKTWAIVLSTDDFSAERCYLEHYNIPEKYMKTGKIQREILSPSRKVKFVFSGANITIGSIINIVKFFPRVILDSEDNFENMERNQ